MISKSGCRFSEKIMLRRKRLDDAPIKFDRIMVQAKITKRQWPYVGEIHGFRAAIAAGYRVPLGPAASLGPSGTR
jgi:hypothetical protein